MTKNPIEQLIARSAALTRFPPNSRYNRIETATLMTPDGRSVTYLRRRFVPSSDDLSLIAVYRVMQEDRLDRIASKFLGDPQLFWRICDGNGAMRPADLTETIGRALRITMPEGVPGTTP